MSVDQSEGDRTNNDFRRSGRPNNTNSPMNFSGGGGPAAAPSSGYKQSYKKVVSNNAASQGVQTGRVAGSDANANANANVTTGGGRVKGNTGKGKKKIRDILKNDDARGTTSNLYNAYKHPEEKKETLSAKIVETSKVEPEDWENAADPALKLGTGLKCEVPARTSSAPPNMDEQKRAQALFGSIKSTSSPNPPVPKQHIPRKDIGSADQHNAGEARPTPKEKKDVLSTPPSVAAHTQKPTGPPMPSVPVHMFFAQSPHQIPFGSPNQQLQSQGMSNTALPVPFSMHIPVAIPPQVPQQVFVPGIQQHYGMFHQSQGLTFSSQMGPSHLGNMGMGMGLGPQYQQAIGNSSAGRRTLKITHPDTHEELTLFRYYSGKQSYKKVASTNASLQGVQTGRVAGSGVNPNANANANVNTGGVPAPNGAHVQPQWESHAVSVTVSDTASLTLEADVASVKVKGNTGKGKKKIRDILKKADARGTTSNLYNAYKHPEEKKEPLSAKIVETSKVEPEDWENTADPAFKLGTGLKREVGNDEVTKKYSRKFLLKFQDQCTNLSEGFEITSHNAEALIASLTLEADVTSDKVKGNTGKGKKKIRDILKNDDARGTTSNLYNAYKHPEEKKETSSAKIVETSKVEPEDWENAADPAFKLGTGLKREVGNDEVTKKYSRKFLLKFQDQCTNLSEGFEITSHNAEALIASLTLEADVTSGKVKGNTGKGKKKIRDILKKADARGTTVNLYNAYKHPEEKKEPLSAKIVETSKVEPEDWENTADPAFKLGTDLKREVGNDEVTKKYSRKFLLKFQDQCTNLSEGFEITSHNAEALIASLTLEADVTSDKVKGNTGKGKKKIRDILKNDDARGTTSNLYNAYKRPEEKKETSSAKIVETIKVEPEDWENAADPAFKLGTGLKREVGNDEVTKKYSRKFLLKFQDQCTNLSEGFEITSHNAEALIASLTLEADVTSDKVKGNTGKGKKKIRDILKNDDARGTTSNLYNAYKRPEEKKETSSAKIVETIKVEPEDWENAADPAFKLGTGLKREVGNDEVTKKYSRKFLLKFQDQCTNLSEGFEITSHNAGALIASSINMAPHPSPGRGGVGGDKLERLDRHHFEKLFEQVNIDNANTLFGVKDQLAVQEKLAQEQERVAKELQKAAEERERALEQRVKELEEQVKTLLTCLKL